MNRIPLEQRFQLADSYNPDFLKIFDMLLNEYLAVLNDLNGEFNSEYLLDCLNEFFDNFGDCKMASLITSTEQLSEEERLSVLYKILVEPFAMMNRKGLERE